MNAAWRLVLNSISSVRQAIAERAGLSHEGERDYYKILGYPVQLKFEDFLAMYSREDVAARVVDMPAQETWRNPPDIVSKDTGEVIEEWDDFVDRLDLWHWCERVDRLSGIGRFGVLLIGAPGALSRQMTIESLDDVKYLNAFHEGDVKIKEWETRTNNERFGMPLMYEITLHRDDDSYGGRWHEGRGRRVDGTEQGKTAAETKIQVHWSRVIHVVDDPLSGNAFGRPRLMRVYNRMIDMVKIAGGSAEMFWQNVAQIFHINLDPELEYTDSDLETLDEKFKEMLMGIRRVIQTEGVDNINTLAGATPDPRGIFFVIKSLISSGAEIPQRILFGSEQGELASTQDQAEWYGRIAARRTRTAEPFIIKPLIRRLNQVRGNDSQKFDLMWPELFELDPQAKANIARAFSMAATKMDPDFPERVISIAEIRELIGLSSEMPKLPDEIQEMWDSHVDKTLNPPEPPPMLGGDEEEGDEDGGEGPPPPPQPPVAEQQGGG